MKRLSILTLIIILGLLPAHAEIDLSDYSLDELVSLRKAIDATIMDIIINNSYSNDLLVNESFEDFLYASNHNEIRINYYRGLASKLIIPSEINGIPVTALHESAFKECETITSIILPDTITIIPERAFYDCSNLSSVVLPSSITKIETSAFMWCPIESIILPDGLVEICSGAFQYCEDLSGILIIPTTVETIGYAAFNMCPLEGVVIQDDVFLDHAAFKNSMKFIYIKEGCDVIMEGETFGSGLEIAVIPYSVSHISDEAFSSCRKLTIITPSGSYAEQYAEEHQIPCETEIYDRYTKKYEIYINKND